MTNKDKFKEVFGIEPDTGHCVIASCSVCGKGSQKLKFDSGYAWGYCHNAEKWWNKEYKENDNGTDN